MKQENFVNLISFCRELNFTGKRIRNSKLEVIEQALQALDLTQYDAAKLVDDIQAYFEDEKSKLEQAKQKASNKKSADTVEGSTVAADLPVLAGDRFIVTCAQNNTVPTEALAQLEALADHIEAQLIILPAFYNKHHFSQAVEDENEYFDPAIEPHLLLDDCWLFGVNEVRLCAEAAIGFTNKMPVNGAQQLNAGELMTIVGNPRQQYRTLPRLGFNDRIRKAWSTGAVTGYNYTRSGAGSKAEKTHKFGGVIVWRDDDNIINSTNIRQGSLNSMMVYFGGTKCLKVNDKAQVSEVLASDNVAVKLGDLHCEKKDAEQWHNALNLVCNLNPRFVAIDDVAHFESRSHHQRNNVIHDYKHRNSEVQNEVKTVIDDINELSYQIDGTVYITESNHNAAVDIWLSHPSSGDDAINSKFYHLASYLLRDAIDHGATGETALALEAVMLNSDLTGLPELASNIEFGRATIPYVGFEYDFSQHGDKGANGARGNVVEFDRWKLKLVTGHTHSPSIINDVFTTGVTGKLNQGYNAKGASNWDHAHVIEHCNGECQLFNTNPQKMLVTSN